jgi:hypothetical protein
MKGIAAVFYRDYRQRVTNIGFVFWDLFVPLEGAAYIAFTMTSLTLAARALNRAA